MGSHVVVGLSTAFLGKENGVVTRSHKRNWRMAVHRQARESWLPLTQEEARNWQEARQPRRKLESSIC